LRWYEIETMKMYLEMGHTPIFTITSASGGVQMGVKAKNAGLARIAALRNSHLDKRVDWRKASISGPSYMRLAYADAIYPTIDRI